jgi:hypothetical protein
MSEDDLTDVERAMLEFTKTPWRYKGQQEEAIREQFGISPTRFWQRIVALVDRPEALAYDPVNVHRLQRLFSRSQAG